MDMTVTDLVGWFVDRDIGTTDPDLGNEDEDDLDLDASGDAAHGCASSDSDRGRRSSVEETTKPRPRRRPPA